MRSVRSFDSSLLLLSKATRRRIPSTDRGRPRNLIVDRLVVCEDPPNNIQRVSPGNLWMSQKCPLSATPSKDVTGNSLSLWPRIHEQLRLQSCTSETQARGPLA